MAMPCLYATMQPEDRNFGQPIAGTLSTIVGSFKSAATKQINPLWDLGSWTISRGLRREKLSEI